MDHTLHAWATGLSLTVIWPLQQPASFTNSFLFFPERMCTMLEVIIALLALVAAIARASM